MEHARNVVLAAVAPVLCLTLAGCFLIPEIPPTAGFSASPTAGEAPLTVQFTDESFQGTGQIDSWAWNFGDREKSTLRHVSHTYTQPGTYTVSLTVAGASGEDMATKKGLITVTTSPTAAFSATPTSGIVPVTVQYTDESVPAGEPIDAWRWNFGDGGTSDEASPSYIYENPGVYAVSLSVFAEHGDDTETQVALITATAPNDVLAISNSSYDFELNDTAWYFQVWNARADYMTEAVFNIATDRGWLSCYPETGSSTGLLDKEDITVTVDRAQLAQGRHKGTITIAGPGIVTRTVVIHVTAGQTGGWKLAEVIPRHASPHLVEFAFSILDEDGLALIAQPAQFEIECSEDGELLGTETAVHLSEADDKQLAAYLILDYTISMADTALNGDTDANGVSDAIDAMETAAKDIFIDALNPDARVGVYEFHRDGQEAQRVAELTTNKAHVKDRIDAIREGGVLDFPAESRCWDALHTVAQAFGEDPNPAERRAIVLLTDGFDQSSHHTQREAIALAWERGIAVYCIGVGAELDYAALNVLADQTGGVCYTSEKAAGLAQSFERVIDNLAGQYVLRWATLRRTEAPFVPAFSLALAGNTLRHRGIDAYVPADYDGDPLAGTLSFTLSEDVSRTAAILRAVYVPRHVTRISLSFGSPHACAVSLVEAADGGIAAGWSLSQEDDPDAGLRHIHVESPDPSDIFTAIPYAAFGPILRFDFDTVESDITALFDSAPVIDSSIYEAGQSFELEWP